ncbi:hypothetical protein MBBAR_10c00680 [Methanobrevibacter arboriphilus JCM 13429 = DSM 1125]|uniref:TRASH domain-containing protein n=1 Tax=Methanobrevibacter arboriphilus JCM 13429 = DSM 1125 TaxID=1300164 RepID=A0A1V6N286_METAZ|nr:hypothetical protein [Methanobrevibacter arboriphilus]OQD58727.1 hypothetical protein MBBAR_10c00680 [Methanobrevibacter arboriphilus JCM 13429 = DSM 1125]
MDCEVCGKTITNQNITGLTYQSVYHGFCSEKCRKEYIKKEKCF